MAEGTLQDLYDAVERQKVTCQECGHRDHSIFGHLREAHGMTPSQYREKHQDLSAGERRLASRLAREFIRVLPRRAQRSQHLDEYLPHFDFQVGDGSGSEVAGQLARQRSELEAIFGEVPEEHVGEVPVVDPGFVLDPSQARVTAYAVRHGRNVFVSGPTGCGKTEGILQVLAHLGRPVLRANMNGDITYRNFVGEPMVGDGRKWFQHGMLPTAMKNGWALIVDEIDYMPAHIGAVLNPVLERGRTLYIPETGERIKAAPGFAVFATANTGGRGDATGAYVGTEPMNVALLDRFPLKLRADYLPPDREEALLLERFPGVPRDEASRMVRMAGVFRRAFATGGVGFPISTRKLLDYCEHRSVGFSAEEALDLVLLNWTDADDAALVQELVQRVNG